VTIWTGLTVYQFGKLDKQIYAIIYMNSVKQTNVYDMDGQKNVCFVKKQKQDYMHEQFFGWLLNRTEFQNRNCHQHDI